MIRLINLELRQKRLKTFLIASFVITAILLGFNYLFAGLPHLPADNELEATIMEFVGAIFGQYETIIAINSILGMFCFSVLGATALSKLVVSDYIGKRANLLFAYPVDRRKLFISKVIVVFVFTILAMLVSNGLAVGIFMFTESHFQLVADGVLSTQLLANSLQIILVFSILSGAIGLISLWFGFKRKSVQATLIPAYIMTVIGSNVLGAPMLLGSVNIVFLSAMTTIALVVGVILTINISSNVNRMEAE